MSGAVKHQPATPDVPPLTPVQRFYGTPTPANAVLLAMADHRAQCGALQPQSEFMAALQKAHDQLLAYPKLVEELRKVSEGDVSTTRAEYLLRDLGEAS